MAAYEDSSVPLLLMGWAHNHDTSGSPDGFQEDHGSLKTLPKVGSIQCRYFADLNARSHRFIKIKQQKYASGCEAKDLPAWLQKLVSGFRTR